MSLALFDAVPAIEVKIDSDNKPWIHRAQYGRFLKLSDVHKSIPIYMEREQRTRSDLEEGWYPIPPLGRSKNPHDMFISSKLALYIAMRSDKNEAENARKWLLDDIIPRGLKNKIKEQRQIIEDCDTRLVLLNDNLAQRDNRIQAIQYENVGLQGEIRAKDQMIGVLRERYVDHATKPGLDNVVMIVRKHTATDEEDQYYDYQYYASRIQRRFITTKRRWIRDTFPNSEEIVIIDNPNSVQAFNRFEEEGHIERYHCHFKLIDLTREDLYGMGIPALQE